MCYISFEIGGRGKDADRGGPEWNFKICELEHGTGMRNRNSVSPLDTECESGWAFYFIIFKDITGLLVKARLA